MSSDWFGSPQHLIAGVLLAGVLAVAACRWVPWALAALLALSVTMTAEALVEVAEWPVIYGSDAQAAAYYDTIADIGATFIGGLVGTALGVALHLAQGRAKRR